VDLLLRREAARRNQKWTPDPDFDEIIASQRQIDPVKWK